MKIGIFSDSYRPYVSGVVLSIETFSRELARLGHEIFIFAPDYPITSIVWVPFLED
jgi:1,2-diacylglycerol 3-alpha-glucosyltransferase